MVYDPKTNHLWVATTAKKVMILDADKMTLVASVDTGSKTTHTGAVNPTTHEVYIYEGDANLLGIYTP